MYIFRLAPISIDSSDWTDASAISYTSIQDPDQALAPAWVSEHAYMTGENVSRNQYVMASLKNNNFDDPMYNYIGRTAEPWTDTQANRGNNTWLKVRLLSQYIAYNRLQPGYTWSLSGNIVASIKPSKTMSAQDAHFFGDGTTSTPLYLILTDIVGDSITIDYLNASDTLISTETVALSHDNDFACDWVFNLELPGSPENTIIRRFDVMDSIETIRLTITAPTTSTENNAQRRAGLGGFYIGRATKIGKTQQDKLSFGFTDFSRLTEDEWGHLNVNKGKVSRNIEAEIFVPTSTSDNAFKLIQHVRATPTFFLFSNRLAEAITTGTRISGLTGIMGLIKSSAIGKKNAKDTSLNIVVEALPTSFNDNMVRLSPYICGTPYLPLVPVTNVIPPTPPTPPPSTVAVTGVTLDRTDIVVPLSKSLTLAATVAPSNAGNKALTWTSSNTNIATVSAFGVVTGQAIGNCVITVTTQQGSFTDTCPVTVSAITPPYIANTFIFYNPLPTDDDFVFNTLR